MNKNIMKILICTLILFIGIGAVSAIEYNSTDEFLSLEQNEVNSTSSLNPEVLSVENNDEEIITVSDNNNSEILGVETNDNEIITVSDNNNEILNLKNNDTEILAKSNDIEVLNLKKSDNEILTANANSSQVLSSGRNSPPSDVPVGTPVITHSSKLKLYFKEEVFAKVKISKKNFKRFILKTPSKKNKKMWKKYKKFMKSLKKKYKKSEKKRVKAIKKKYDMIDWYYGIRNIFVLKGKYCTINWVCMGYNYGKY